jgi:hypothetical protein
LIAEEWFGHGTIRCGISYEQGVKAERERIIKLINDLDISFVANSRTPDCIIGDSLDLIALIKGEK